MKLTSEATFKYLHSLLDLLETGLIGTGAGVILEMDSSQSNIEVWSNSLDVVVWPWVGGTLCHGNNILLGAFRYLTIHIGSCRAFLVVDEVARITGS